MNLQGLYVLHSFLSRTSGIRSVLVVDSQCFQMSGRLVLNLGKGFQFIPASSRELIIFSFTKIGKRSLGFFKFHFSASGRDIFFIHAKWSTIIQIVQISTFFQILYVND